MRGALNPRDGESKGFLRDRHIFFWLVGFDFFRFGPRKNSKKMSDEKLALAGRKEMEVMRSMHAELVSLPGKAIEIAVALGEYFTRKKKELPHGEFAPWCRTNFPEISADTIERYRHVFEHQDELRGNADTLTKAYRLLNKRDRLTDANKRSPESASKLIAPSTVDDIKGNVATFRRQMKDLWKSGRMEPNNYHRFLEIMFDVVDDLMCEVEDQEKFEFVDNE